jgi:hypothetical protein
MKEEVTTSIGQERGIFLEGNSLERHERKTYHADKEKKITLRRKSKP